MNQGAAAERAIPARRGVKISPLVKVDYRKKFIDKCLQRVKRDRESNFEKLRNRYNEDCGSYARDIVSDALYPTAPLEREFADSTHPDAMAISTENDQDEEGMLDADFYMQVMEQVALELEMEYAECMEEQNQEALLPPDVTGLGDEDEILDTEFLLCPFCRVSNMDSRGNSFYCYSCGGDFCNLSGILLNEIRDRLGHAVVRHRECCSNSGHEENKSPDLLMCFRWNGEQLFATCDHCLFYDPIL